MDKKITTKTDACFFVMIFAMIKTGTKIKMHQSLQFKTAITSPSTKASNIIKTGLFITVLLYALFCFY